MLDSLIMKETLPPTMAIDTEYPLRFEGEVFDLEVIDGEIPIALDGLYAQAVGEHQFPPKKPTMHLVDFVFNGDGQVRTFRFKNGRVDFLTRYVRTARFKAERAVRKSLFGHYRNPYTDDPSVRGVDRTTANTAVYFHAGMLLASKEDGPPYQMDPATLETIGPWRANGRITSATWTAHPKFDQRSGEMIGFGYAARGECSRDMAYYVVDKSGQVTHEAWFEAPVSAMIHDCAITDNFTVFPIMPLASDKDRLRSGGLHFQYQPEMELTFGMIPRFGTSRDVKWFRAPHAFPGHTVNAFERDGLVHFDMLQTNGNLFGLLFPDKAGNTSVASLRTEIVRWTLDYKEQHPHHLCCRSLASVGGEGPHIDARFSMEEYRYVWLADVIRSTTERTDNLPLSALFNAVSCIDVIKGTRDYWAAGQDASVQEPLYIQKNAGAQEGDGYVIVLVNRYGRAWSELVVLEALDLSQGPIAKIRIPMNLKNGVHTAWIDSARLSGTP